MGGLRAQLGAHTRCCMEQPTERLLTLALLPALAADGMPAEQDCPAAPSGYTFYPGKNSNGGDLEQRGGTVDELAAQCNENVQVSGLV